MRGKIFSIVIIMLLSFMTNELKSSCSWLPNGYSNVGWSEDKTAKIKISDDCWLIYTYCYRMHNGERQVVITSTRTKGKTPWYLFSSCLNELNRKKQLMLDYAVNMIALTINPFQVPLSLAPCPNYGNNVVRVVESSCVSEWFFDWSENDGDYVRKPCNGTGYCEYVYKYCMKLDPVTGQILGSAYTKTLEISSNLCVDVTYYDANANVMRDCYSQLCSPARPNLLKFITAEQILDPTIDDDNIYSINEW